VAEEYLLAERVDERLYRGAASYHLRLLAGSWIMAREGAIPVATAEIMEEAVAWKFRSAGCGSQAASPCFNVGPWRSYAGPPAGLVERAVGNPVTTRCLTGIPCWRVPSNSFAGQRRWTFTRASQSRSESYPGEVNARLPGGVRGASDGMVALPRLHREVRSTGRQRARR
jgi:hypothetical protein